jgi:hypothetical protein
VLAKQDLLPVEGNPAFGLESIWTYCRYVEIGPNGVRGDYFSGQPLFIDLSGCARKTALSSLEDDGRNTWTSGKTMNRNDGSRGFDE